MHSILTSVIFDNGSKSTVLLTTHLEWRCKSVSPDVTVCGHVCIEIGDMAECLVAHRALVRCCRGMGSLVLLEMRLLPEPLVAHQTFKRPLTWVGWAKNNGMKETRRTILFLTHLSESSCGQSGST